jgi:RNA polymerase sigma-70 factor (ECF subfamily)
MDAADEAAFRDFVVGRSAALLRSAYLLTGDRGHAEDALQAALARVYAAWPRIRHREAVESYTRRAMVREVQSWRRRRRVGVVLTDHPPDRPVLDTPGSDDDVRSALLALPARQRAVVVLRYFDDLSEPQVADALGISVGAVKQHASRALTALRSRLGTTNEETLR